VLRCIIFNTIGAVPPAHRPAAGSADVSARSRAAAGRTDRRTGGRMDGPSAGLARHPRERPTSHRRAGREGRSWIFFPRRWKKELLVDAMVEGGWGLGVGETGCAGGDFGEWWEGGEQAGRVLDAPRPTGGSGRASGRERAAGAHRRDCGCRVPVEGLGWRLRPSSPRAPTWKRGVVAGRGSLKRPRIQTHSSAISPQGCSSRAWPLNTSYPQGLAQSTANLICKGLVFLLITQGWIN